MSQFETAIILGLVGVLLAQIALMFFMDEIFRFFDRVVNRVRKWCGLGPI